jgi:hypothetical protein
VLPVEVVEHALVLGNGVNTRPCKFVTQTVTGMEMLIVSNCSKDWCWLLAGESAFNRPLAGLSLWDTWREAVKGKRSELAAQAKAAKKVPIGAEYSLEGEESDSDDDSAVHIANWRQIGKLNQRFPIIRISLPSEPGSAEMRDIDVINNERVFGFRCTLPNVQWLRDYVINDTKVNTATRGPAGKRKRTIAGTK